MIKPVHSRNTTKCTVLQCMHAITSLHLQGADIKISLKHITINSAVLIITTNVCLLWPILVPHVFKKFRRQFPEDGQITVPKHVGAM